MKQTIYECNSFFHSNQSYSIDIVFLCSDFGIFLPKFSLQLWKSICSDNWIIVSVIHGNVIFMSIHQFFTSVLLCVLSEITEFAEIFIIRKYYYLFSVILSILNPLIPCWKPSNQLITLHPPVPLSCPISLLFVNDKDTKCYNILEQVLCKLQGSFEKFVQSQRAQKAVQRFKMVICWFLLLMNVY